MPGALVFPGGVVEEEDRIGSDALKNCAIREVREESGIVIPNVNELLHLCDWETPTDVAISLGPKGGYKTRFFVFILSHVPMDGTIRPDGMEISELVWINPLQAPKIDGLPFPQQHILAYLALCKKRSNLIAHAKFLRNGIYRYPYKPVVFLENESGRSGYLLPGDSQHDRFRPSPSLGPIVHHRAYTTSVRGRADFSMSESLHKAVEISGKHDTEWCRDELSAKL